MEYLNTSIGDYFCFVDATTGVAISYDLRSDWDLGIAWLNFVVGLRSQFTRLEIFEVRDWDKTRQLFQAMRLHAKNLVPALCSHGQPTDGLAMGLATQLFHEWLDAGFFFSITQVKRLETRNRENV